MKPTGLRFDARESPKHRVFLETPGTFAYLPTAVRWAVKPEVVSVALVCGIPVGLFSGTLTALWLSMLFGSGAVVWVAGVLTRAVWGFGDPPALRSEDIAGVGPAAIRAVVVGWLVVSGYLVLPESMPTVRVAYAIVTGALLPAAFALIAVEQALAPALDPRRLWRVLAAGGVVGWVLAATCGWGMIGMLAAADEALGNFGTAVALINTPPSVAGALTVALVIWLAAVAAHLFGHALHHRHELAGLDVMLNVPDEIEAEGRSRARMVASAADRLESAANAHDKAAALRIVTETPPEGVDPVVYYFDLWDAMHRRKLGAAATLVAAPLLAAAVNAKRYELATEVWRVVRKMSPSFKLEPGIAARFAEQARVRGDAAIEGELMG